MQRDLFTRQDPRSSAATTSLQSAHHAREVRFLPHKAVYGYEWYREEGLRNLPELVMMRQRSTEVIVAVVPQRSNANEPRVIAANLSVR